MKLFGSDESQAHFDLDDNTYRVWLKDGSYIDARADNIFDATRQVIDMDKEPLNTFGDEFTKPPKKWLDLLK